MKEFHEAIDSLIRMNKRNRLTLDMKSYTMSAPHFAEDFCTVRVDIGRRTGKTSYILSKLMEQNNSLVITNSMQQAMLKSKGYTEVITCADIEYYSRRVSAYSTIFVDEPSLLTCSLHSIYSVFAKNAHQTFVLLGR